MSRMRDVRLFEAQRLILPTVVAVVLLGSLVVPTGPVAEAGTPPEFAAVTANCIAAGFRPGSPIFTGTLYNLPPNASPTVTGSITSGNTTTALNNPNPPTNQGQGIWTFGVGDGLPLGAYFVVSLRWSDGVGGGGSHSQPVGVPKCNTPVSRRASAMAANADGTAYWDVTTDGLVQSHLSGNAFEGDLYGDLANLPLNAPIVGMAALPGHQGYWLVGADGGVFGFGLAGFYGSTGGMRLNEPIVGMASTPDGGGYWLVASDGGVFAFGDAQFDGSMGGSPLNRPVVGMAADQSTGGYWLVASDGGVFSFNAPFHGSTGNIALNQPIIGLQAAPDGSGYRLGARDGGVFSFDVPFAGSFTGQDSNPMVAITGIGSAGYWLLDSCGGVYAFGTAPFNGAASVC